jgi:2-dehydropantoate 2-reductase
MKQITILGVGAMACLFGGQLAALAHVTLVGQWAAQHEAIARDGLTLHLPNGRIQHTSLPTTTDPLSVPPADLLLILVKSHQTACAATQAAHCLAPHGLALTLQNGLGNVEQLTAVLGANRVTLGITSAGATVIAPGQVRVAGFGHTTLAYGAGTETAVTEIVHLFTQAGFPTEMTTQPDGLIWGKLAVNAGINPLTALLRVPNGYLAQNPQARAVMMAAARETAVVAQALGISLPYADAGEQALAVAQATAANHSSMLQDVLRGAPTELAAITGAVCQYGRATHTPTPVNDALYTAVLEMENGRLLSPQTYLEQLGQLG